MLERGEREKGRLGGKGGQWCGKEVLKGVVLELRVCGPYLGEGGEQRVQKQGKGKRGKI